MARRSLHLVVATLVLALGSTAAGAERLEPETVLLVGRASPRAPWQGGPLEARRDDRPEMAVVVVARVAGQRAPVYVVDEAVAPLRLGGREVVAASRRSFAALGRVAVRWSTVEPHAWREAGRPARNGVTSRYHSNVSVERGTFGKWLGYDEIRYFETVAAEWAEGPTARRRPASARPPLAAEDRFDGLGTMRYRVEVRVNGGRVLATPGAAAVDQFGILPSVFRVSLRRDDSFVGHLTSYFLVPEVFGSAGPGANHQTERFTGADCADVLTGALRRMGYDRVWHPHVAGLTKYARVVAGPVQLDDQGVPATPVTGVQVGDLIRIRYGAAGEWVTRRGWDHVAVLYQDRSDPAGPHQGKPDGRLDGFDVVVHMGHPRLEVEPLERQTPARVDVLRWDPRRIGPRRGRAAGE
jgi:hypothetical protein